jgi:hypothetical protein
MTLGIINLTLKGETRMEKKLKFYEVVATPARLQGSENFITEQKIYQQDPGSRGEVCAFSER